MLVSARRGVMAGPAAEFIIIIVGLEDIRCRRKHRQDDSCCGCLVIDIRLDMYPLTFNFVLQRLTVIYHSDS